MARAVPDEDCNKAVNTGTYQGLQRYNSAPINSGHLLFVIRGASQYVVQFAVDVARSVTSEFTSVYVRATVDRPNSGYDWTPWKRIKIES